MLKETIKKNRLFLILPIAVLFVTFSLMATSIFSAPITTTTNAVETSFFSTWCYTVERADGSIEDIGCSHNVVYNDGINATVETLTGLTGALNFSRIALCNGTNILGATNNSCGIPVAAQTEAWKEFNGCGLSPAQATINNNLHSGAIGGNRSLVATFTSTCASQLVNASRLQEAVTFRNISGDKFADVTLNNQDKITINITFTVV